MVTLATTLPTTLPTTLGAAGPVTLAGLSGPAQSALRAVWWTRRLVPSFVGSLYDATHLYDQSGNGKDLVSGAAIGTATEGADTALVLDAGVPNTFTRGDALGLAADPALTVVWKMRCTNGGTFPGIFSLGTLGSEEFDLWMNDVGNIAVSDSGAAAVTSWDVTDVSTLWATYVFTKPAASGLAGTCRLSVAPGALTAPDNVSAIGLTLGNSSIILGDFDGGGFPFGGHLAGMVVIERELSGADLALVQAL